jgi:hypothetical protein
MRRMVRPPGDAAVLHLDLQRISDTSPSLLDRGLADVVPVWPPRNGREHAHPVTDSTHLGTEEASGSLPPTGCHFSGCLVVSTLAQVAMDDDAATGDRYAMIGSSGIAQRA